MSKGISISRSKVPFLLKRDIEKLTSKKSSISLKTDVDAYLCMWFFFTCISTFGKCLFRSCGHLGGHELGFFVFLLSFVSFCIFEYKSFFGFMLCKYFLQIYGLFFYYVRISFEEKFLKFWWVINPSNWSKLSIYFL